jgi:hypothetical protein
MKHGIHENVERKFQKVRLKEYVRECDPSTLSEYYGYKGSSSSYGYKD